jgi:hypothetical protein
MVLSWLQSEKMAFIYGGLGTPHPSQQHQQFNRLYRKMLGFKVTGRAAVPESQLP